MSASPEVTLVRRKVRVSCSGLRGHGRHGRRCGPGYARRTTIAKTNGYFPALNWMQRWLSVSFRAEVVARLSAESLIAAHELLVLIDKERLKPISVAPASTTAHEALRLWRTRLRNTTITHQEIIGLAELVHSLGTLTPQKKVEQYGFAGPSTTLTIFFESTSRAFVGSTLTKGPGRHRVAKPANSQALSA